VLLARLTSEAVRLCWFLPNFGWTICSRNVFIARGAVVQVLGDHVDQKGSIVQPDRLRFDFSHSGPIDGPTLGKIENICNEQLARKLQIFEKETPLSDARRINGALLFPFMSKQACEAANVNVVGVQATACAAVRSHMMSGMLQGCARCLESSIQIQSGWFQLASPSRTCLLTRVTQRTANTLSSSAAARI
jgi:hypothetical protein